LEAGPLETPPMLSPLGGRGGTNGWEMTDGPCRAIGLLAFDQFCAMIYDIAQSERRNETCILT
jgi:hypothetical protein